MNFVLFYVLPTIVCVVATISWIVIDLFKHRRVDGALLAMVIAAFIPIVNLMLLVGVIFVCFEELSKKTWRL